MFGFQPINFTLVAAGAIPIYHVVQASGANYGGLATAATQALVGIAQQAPAAAGEFVSVCGLGDSRAYAGGTISLGARVTSSSSGRVIAAASGDVFIGYAAEAGAAGDLIKVRVVANMDKMVG